MLPTLLNSARHSMPRCARDRRASLRIWLVRNLGRSEMLGVCSISTFAKFHSAEDKRVIGTCSPGTGLTCSRHPVRNPFMRRGCESTALRMTWESTTVVCRMNMEWSFSVASSGILGSSQSTR